MTIGVVKFLARLGTVRPRLKSLAPDHTISP
jgi:hypothetical protein